ncbi:MAG: hypothetical protein IT445_19155 [Phycisphaeraceae bacterium]|nr:hypothetical protein [Phycisphaeraceae bacterium]
MIASLAPILAVCMAISAAAGDPSADPPLHDDGCINYIKLYNRSLGEQPANKDNACIGLLLASNLSDWDPAYRAALFKAFGLTDTDVHEPLFSDHDESIQDQYDAALDGPWTDEQYPQLTAWLDAQEPALKRIEQALARPHYYLPLVVAEGEKPVIITSIMPQLGQWRVIARGFKLRAFRALGRGDTAEAWRNAELIFVLARRVYEDRMIMGQVIATSINSMATQVAAALRDDPNTDAILLSAIAKQLDCELPDHLVEAVDHIERWSMLDMLAWCTSGDPEVYKRLEAPAFITPCFTDPLFDQQQAAKEVNARFDRVVAVMRLPDVSQALREFTDIDNEHATNSNQAIALTEPGGRQRIQQLPEPQRGQTYTKLATDLFLGWLMPSLDGAYKKEWEIRIIRSAHRVAVAVVRYQREHGDWPASLDDLVPQYLDALPTDAFSGDPLIYRRTATGPIIYSIGTDGVDDGGTTTNSAPYRDLVVRIKAP